MLEAASGVGVPDAVDWANNMFDNWMEYESRYRSEINSYACDTEVEMN